MTSRIFNFAPGPACLPDSVLEEAQKDLLNYKGCGRSVMELSHRSKVFEEIIGKAEKNLRTLLKIPDNYTVLFIQGGGTGQFAGVPLNLLGKSEGKHCDYLVTGSWSQKALEEAHKFGKPSAACNGKKDGKYAHIPSPSEWKQDPEAEYLYYCSNETVHGVEFHYTPETDKILVADMSSNFLSRTVDVSKHGVICSGAQKNSGIAGVTVVIVRNDLLDRAEKICPAVLHWETMAKNKSLYNTPPTWSIYIAGLMYQWMLDQGGLEAIEKRNIEKAQKVYDVLDSSDFWRPCVEKEFRSRMNITVRLENEQLEKKFVEEAASQGMIELSGHRSVGGIRISIYNSMPMEGVNKLVDFMKQFEAKNKK